MIKLQIKGNDKGLFQIVEVKNGVSKILKDNINNYGEAEQQLKALNEQRKIFG